MTNKEKQRLFDDMVGKCCVRAVFGNDNYRQWLFPNAYKKDYRVNPALYNDIQKAIENGVTYKTLNNFVDQIYEAHKGENV